jgi:hypothetical protein
MRPSATTSNCVEVVGIGKPQVALLQNWPRFSPLRFSQRLNSSHRFPLDDFPALLAFAEELGPPHGWLKSGDGKWAFSGDFREAPIDLRFRMETGNPRVKPGFLWRTSYRFHSFQPSSPPVAPPSGGSRGLIPCFRNWRYRTHCVYASVPTFWQSQ